MIADDRLYVVASWLEHGVEVIVSPQEEDVGSDTIASFIILFSIKINKKRLIEENLLSLQRKR